jgi:predicted RNA-binding Zn-ribbon protein involved in translation (DUF1610 family)
VSSIIQETLADLKARQLAGEHMLCPRCGQDAMDQDVHRNARSRYAEIQVCDDCGISEAMLAIMQNPLPLAHWVCFKAQRPPGDFEGLPGMVVKDRLKKEQIPFLCQLFERWQEEQEHEDFEEYRLEAHRHCPGLTELWKQPFQAAYRVADGELFVRFRSSPEGTQVACDLDSTPRR